MTQEVQDGNSVVGRSMRNTIVDMECEKCLQDAQKHQSTMPAAEIAYSTSWLKLWDMGMGPLGTASFQALFRELTRPVFVLQPCNHCNINHLCKLYFNHFISTHSNLGVCSTIVISQVAAGDRDIFCWQNSCCTSLRTHEFRFSFYSLLSILWLSWLPCIEH